MEEQARLKMNLRLINLELDSSLRAQVSTAQVVSLPSTAIGIAPFRINIMVVSIAVVSPKGEWVHHTTPTPICGEPRTRRSLSTKEAAFRGTKGTPIWLSHIGFVSHILAAQAEEDEVGKVQASSGGGVKVNFEDH